MRLVGNLHELSVMNEGANSMPKRGHIGVPLHIDWYRRARESSRIHYACADSYHRRHYLIGTPTIVLSTLSVAASVFSSIEGFAAASQLFVPVSSCMVAALSTL